MEPTYLHQAVLDSPLPLTTRRFENQPIANSEIDKWLEANKADSHHSDVLLPGYLHIDDVPHDQVLCMVLATVGEYIDEIYNDRHVLYHLWIAVGAPASSGISFMSRASPLAALATFVSVTSEMDTPEDTPEDVPQWTRDMKPRCPLVFRQPRGAIAELFSALAFWHPNSIIRGLSNDMVGWAFAVAIRTPAESKNLIPLPLQTTRLANATAPARSHARRNRAKPYDVATRSPTPARRL